VVGTPGCHHCTTYAAETSVDPSTSSPSGQGQTAPDVVSSRCDDETSDDVVDGPRLTAVYLQSKKSSAGAKVNDVTGQCPSPASSSNRASPGANYASPHQAPGRHRQSPAISRTLPQIAGSGDAVGVGRQRVSFQVAEPRSQSSTCIATADARPRRRTDVADADHYRTSSVDDMRTCRTPDRSPKPPRRAAVQTRHTVDVALHAVGDSATASRDVAETPASSSQPTDIID